MDLYDKRFNYIEKEEDIVPAFKDDGYDLFEQNTTNFYDSESCVIKLKNEDRYFVVTVFVTMVGAWQDVGDKLYTIDSIDDVTYTEISYEDLKRDFNQKIKNKISILEKEIKTLESSLIK